MRGGIPKNPVILLLSFLIDEINYDNCYDCNRSNKRIERKIAGNPPRCTFYRQRP